MVKEITEEVLACMREGKILIKRMPALLNRYLPEGEKITDGRSGAVQVSRWLAGLVEPRASIIIAMQKFAVNQTKINRRTKNK